VAISDRYINHSDWFCKWQFTGTGVQWVTSLFDLDFRWAFRWA